MEEVSRIKMIKLSTNSIDLQQYNKRIDKNHDIWHSMTM